MKRLLVGFLWFAGLYLGGHFALGFSVGFQGGLKGQSEEEMNQMLKAIDKELDSTIFLISAASAVAGTATQKLPGTKE